MRNKRFALRSVYSAFFLELSQNLGPTIHRNFTDKTIHQQKFDLISAHSLISAHCVLFHPT